MDWSKGYSATYYATRVDPVTWRDAERIEITGGTISRTTESLMHSADIQCTQFDSSREEWIRVYLDVAQDGDYAHEALFTGLATSPDKDMHGRMVTHALECYSVLKPADDIVLMRGWYVPAGTNGALQAAELLGVGAAPVEVADNGPALQTTIIAEDGETRLSMAQKILDAVDWRVRLSGDGTINIEPKATEPVAIFDPLEFDVIETELTTTADWYSCPNVVMVIDDDLTAIARDDSPRSPLSTVNRGREVWYVETNADYGANESIEQFAYRRLSELQTAELKAKYDRRYVPQVMPGDLVTVHYPEQGLDDNFRVGTQSVELGHGARTSEEITTPARLALLQDRMTEPAVGLVRLVSENGDYIVSANSDYIVGLRTEGANNG